MASLYKKGDDNKLLMQSVRLCQAIEPYIDVLGLDWNEVRNFKDEIQAIVYITENFKSFSNSFFLYNKGNIRLSMKLLISQCEASESYTAEIGKALGIEKDSNYNATAFPDLTFYLHHLN
jgi:hypothetical protein